MASTPSFISLMNKTGIACAASDDFTICRLSSEEPLAIAVNPRSKIPWESIVDEYRRQGGPEPEETLAGYADAFVDFLSGIPYDRRWAGADEDGRRVIFLGYGCNDVYPSALTLQFTPGDVDFESIGQIDTVTIGAVQESAIRTMGNFDRLAPLLRGASSDVLRSFEQRQLQTVGVYRDRLAEAVKGSGSEDGVRWRLDDDYVRTKISINHAAIVENKEEEINDGLRHFSMTDLVLSAETIINANVRLSCLLSGQRPPSECVREIAVITRPEGIRWIKHSYIFE